MLYLEGQFKNIPITLLIQFDHETNRLLHKHKPFEVALRINETQPKLVLLFVCFLMTLLSGHLKFQIRIGFKGLFIMFLFPKVNFHDRKLGACQQKQCRETKSVFTIICVYVIH